MLKILILILTSNIALAGPIKDQIMENKKNISEDKAKTLESLIIKHSDSYNIPKKLFTAILMQESGYDIKAVNKKCGAELNLETKKIKDLKEVCVVQDVGISQININTIKAYNFNTDKLESDLSYSIEAGAIVLSWFYEKYQEKEPKTWFCRYNVGTAPLEKVKSSCNKYITSVNRWL